MTGRRVAVALLAVVALAGGLLVASSLLMVDRPGDWLDDNAERTDDDTWTADEPPLRLAAALASAVKPQSRYVDGTGVALRYHHQTVTITPGTAEGTSVVYLDRRGGTRRTYVGGRLLTNGFAPNPRADGSTPGTPTGGSATTETRRGSSFRGGGPGSGK